MCIGSQIQNVLILASSNVIPNLTQIAPGDGSYAFATYSLYQEAAASVSLQYLSC